MIVLLFSVVLAIVLTLSVRARGTTQSTQCPGPLPGQGPLPDEASVVAVARTMACKRLREGAAELVLQSVRAINGQEYQQLLSERGVVNADELAYADLQEPNIWEVTFQGDFKLKRTGPDGEEITGHVLTLMFNAQDGSVFSLTLAP